MYQPPNYWFQLSPVAPVVIARLVGGAAEPRRRWTDVGIPDCTWRVFLGEQLVGTANLVHHDTGMNVRFGPFMPGPAYPLVQDIFRLFFAADGDESLVEDYYGKRDALTLIIVDHHGDVREGTVHIVDCTAEHPEEPLEVTILPC